MIAGSVCISHSPLLDKARAGSGVEGEFFSAVDRASQKIAEWAPDVTVVFFPDHFNGFFLDLMPSFCIGARANSIGDFGTIPGTLDVPESLAVNCAEACIAAGIDVATSYKMNVDHGAVQPIELLSGVHPLSKIIPIFINCAAHPRPTYARVAALGEAVGRWAETLDLSVMFVASGGLSHDPPMPVMANASRDVQDALINNSSLPHSGRLARQNRAFEARHGFVSGDSPLCPLNENWDRAFLKSAMEGDLSVCNSWSDDEVMKAAGRGAHEVRAWVAALAAMNIGRGYEAELEFYHPIKEWLTGIAILTAEIPDG